MSVFGSQNEDPLLQNDPLAPSTEGDNENEAPDDQELSSVESTDGEMAPPDASQERADSVFGSTSREANRKENGAPPEKGENPRVMVRSITEAARGGLAAVNEALEDGWRLERVQVNEVSSAKCDAGAEAPLAQSGLTLAFVLRRPEKSK